MHLAAQLRHAFPPPTDPERPRAAGRTFPNQGMCYAYNAGGGVAHLIDSAGRPADERKLLEHFKGLLERQGYSVLAPQGSAKPPRWATQIL